MWLKQMLHKLMHTYDTRHNVDNTEKRASGNEKENIIYLPHDESETLKRKSL